MCSDTNLAPLERIGDETTEDTETESADETTENDEIMTADETSTAYVIATADETTTAAENTTILPENQPKSGTAELLVENIVSRNAYFFREFKTLQKTKVYLIGSMIIYC